MAHVNFYKNAESLSVGDYQGIKVSIGGESGSSIFYHVMGMFDEIIDGDCYRLKGLSDSEDFVLIDIGANRGLVSLLCAKLNNCKKVYSFEPFSSVVDLFKQSLVESAQSVDISKIQIHPYGLGRLDSERTIEHFYTVFDSCNSVVYPNDIEDWLHIGDRSETVVIKNAESVLKNIVFKHNDCKIVCKIDTEGSEYEIFESLSDDTLCLIDRVMIEFHPYFGDNASETLVKRLESCGFRTERVFCNSHVTGNKDYGMLYGEK